MSSEILLGNPSQQTDSFNAFEVNRVSTLKELAQNLISEIETLSGAPPAELPTGINLTEAVKGYEVSLIKRALLIAKGNQRKASLLLGLRHTTLNSKIKRYNIEF